MPPFLIMTRRCRTSPAPLPFTTRRSRQPIHNEDLDDDLRMIADNYNDHRHDNSESDNEPLPRLSSKAMVKWPSNNSFTSTLGHQVTATQFTPTSSQPLHPERGEIHILLEEEDERKPALLVSKKVPNSAFE